MNAHVTDHLSEYLDDELGAAERAAIDAHLHDCASCADELDAVRRIVAHAATASEHDTAPARDLWSGIHARMHERPTAFDERAMHTGVARRKGETAKAARISFSIAQLAAAAAILIVVSGATAWFVRGNVSAPQPVVTTAVVQAEIEPSAAADAIRPVNFADAQYDAAVSDLEQALQERRNDLNPRTVEILERNLKLIDAAIAQARQALEEDPGNTYLNRHLVESRRRKLDLLRRATAITEGD